LNNILSLIFCAFTLAGFSQNNSTITIDSLASNCLNETRKFFIYQPKDFDPKQAYPIIYCTDGQKMIEHNYAALFDSLIQVDVIAPTIVIGAYSSEKNQVSHYSDRQREYIKNYTELETDKQRYLCHETFFVNELPNYVGEKYNVITDTTKKSFFGVSNGGGFGLTLYLENNYHFTHFICLSPLGNIPIKKNKAKSVELPSLYIGFGDNEPAPLVTSYEKQVQLLIKKKYKFSYNQYHGGHNDVAWKKELVKALNESKK
jgi:enterochelin esterase-like enzyme